jgi:hypothetical protein
VLVFDLILRSTLLSLGPSVREHRGRVIARTNFLLRALTLFSYSHEVVVDRKSRYVSVSTRRMWFLKSGEAIPFRSVQRIHYGYASLPTSVGHTTDGVGVTDRLEKFTVALILEPEAGETRGREVELFAFRGEGSGDGLGLHNIIDLEGAQETTSLQFVRLLQKHIGVSLAEATPHLADSHGRKWTCLGCGRPGPPNARRCYYCGGEVAPPT